MSESLSATSYTITHWITQVGVMGVNFFFVLSAFLITYLLLLEEQLKDTFSIRNFYVRRILRIWPLYYGIVICSFFIIPSVSKFFHHPISESAPPLPYFLFFSNFDIIKNGFPYSPLLAVLWSISVEEQFYFCWPWLLRFFKKRMLSLFAIILIVSIAFRADFYFQSKIIYFHTFSIISDFAWGGAIAWLAIHREDFILFFQKINSGFLLLGYSVLILLLVFYEFIFSGPIMITWERFTLGAGFAFVIAEQSFGNEYWWHGGRIPILSWLGKISFGLYCFHLAALIGVKDLMNLFRFTSIADWYILLPILSLTLTTLAAAISYYGFEEWFLKWKKKWN